jgi:hypothetical protein
MVAGMLLSLVGILLMWSASSYPQLLVGHLIVQISLNGAAAAYYGIIPDVAPEGEFGKASGFLSVMTATGALRASPQGVPGPVMEHLRLREFQPGAGVCHHAAMILPGLLCGAASDRHGRKPFVYLLADGAPATGVGMRSGAADGLCELHRSAKRFSNLEAVSGGSGRWP